MGIKTLTSTRDYSNSLLGSISNATAIKYIMLTDVLISANSILAI